MDSLETDSTVAVTNGEDTQDIFPFRSAETNNRAEDTAKLVVHKEAYFYKMDHPKRGLAVIFNHEKFIYPNLKDRAGTQADCDSLIKVWEKIGFEVVVHQDLGIKAMKDELVRLSKEVDYSDMDCLVMCVLSHGEEGIIYTKDSAYKQEELWERFTADKCKTLAGKPKLFFIQACQGRKLDPGVRLVTELDGKVDSYKIPIHADFLFAYSTIPGNIFSNKNNNRKKKRKSFLSKLKSCFFTDENSIEQYAPSPSGLEDCNPDGWFMEVLCAQLEEKAFTFHLLQILTFVNWRITRDFLFEVPDEYRNELQRQLCWFSSTLTRLVQFKPRNND